MNCAGARLFVNWRQAFIVEKLCLRPFCLGKGNRQRVIVGFCRAQALNLDLIVAISLYFDAQAVEQGLEFLKCISLWPRRLLTRMRRTTNDPTPR